MLIFDPRDGFHKETDNPALILGDLVLHGFSPEELDPEFMLAIAEYADYCEEMVPVEPGDVTIELHGPPDPC